MFRPLRAQDEELTVAGVIGQGLGYASMCWEQIEDAGVFQSDRVSAAVESVQREVKAIITGRLVKLMDTQNSAREWNEAIEAAICAIEELR